MEAPVFEVNNIFKSFELLLTKRISAVAHQEIDADPFIKKQGYTDIEKLQPAIKSKPYFLMLSHQFVDKHPQLAQQLWDRIGEIRDNKTREISPKYKYNLE